MKKVFRSIAVAVAAALLVGALFYLAESDTIRDFDWRLVII